MAHIFFIDPIEKLNTRKDTSLFMAMTFMAQGEDVFLLFEKDFFIQTGGAPSMEMYRFKGEFGQDSFYISHFELTEKVRLPLGKNDCFHMRIDPPMDQRYVRYLWMQKYLESFGVQVLNRPEGILCHNEKLYALENPDSAVESYIGSTRAGLEDFVERLKEKPNFSNKLIMKPMDLYSGIGVEMVELEGNDYLSFFEEQTKKFNGPIMVQPFLSQVLEGEHRSIFFNGVELGTIIKLPQKGEFLTNIAQGADYRSDTLSSAVKAVCSKFSNELAIKGVPFVAFDILGDSITEINITCPGLLLEVSEATGENLTLKLYELLKVYIG